MTNPNDDPNDERRVWTETIDDGKSNIIIVLDPLACILFAVLLWFLPDIFGPILAVALVFASLHEVMRAKGSKAP